MWTRIPTRAFTFAALRSRALSILRRDRKLATGFLSARFARCHVRGAWGSAIGGGLVLTAAWDREVGAAVGFYRGTDFAEALGDGARGGNFAVGGGCVGGREVLVRRVRWGGKNIRHAAEIALVSAETEDVSRIL